MKKMELLLTRHGETIENQRHVLQGQLPGTLSALGRQQAEDLARRLEEEEIDAVVSSDLARSYETALVVARAKGLEVCPTPLLREMDWGIYTGESLEDVDWMHLPPSVESVEEQYHRAGEFIGFLKVKFPGKKVLAVGHGAFNRAVLTYLSSGNPWDMVEMRIMENTEIIRCEVV